MTATEFRDKKTREIQELFEKLSSLEESNLSPEMKDVSFASISAKSKDCPLFWAIPRSGDLFYSKRF